MPSNFRQHSRWPHRVLSPLGRPSGPELSTLNHPSNLDIEASPLLFFLQGFLVHTGHIGGLVLRGGFGKEARINAWSLGDKTDETSHIVR